MENNLKIVYKEEYSDDKNLGDIIDSNIKKDDVIDITSPIEIIISKGNLKMIKLTDLSEFINFATTNNIDYEINYEYSNTIKKR